jgi:hypothetical protein
VQPTFTEAAYYNAFYVFYNKYNNVTAGIDVTTDLNLLTASLNYSKVFCCKDKNDIKIIGSQIKDALPNATVTNLSDQDIEEGNIFLNQKNAFDVIILLKEEYLTQEMYNSLKHFVFQGGTIIFLNGNFFYAEVNYDKDANAIILVKGHSWEFNGTAAKRSVIERWFNTTKDWVGSNFLTIPSYSKELHFANNIFNYTHNEEDYVNNNKDIIILDYGAYTIPPGKLKGKIATYELDYGKGKSLVIGLFGQDLLKNNVFLSFFKDTILKYAAIIIPSSQQNLIYDSKGVPLVNYGPIIGYQRNPVTIGNTIMRFSDNYTQTGNSTYLEYVKNNADWLVANARSYGNYSLFEYQFPYVYSLTPPWHSALAQGEAIQALTKAYQVTQNATYLQASVPLLNSFYVDVKGGGITEKTNNQGWWYEEYAQKNGKNPRVLNGMMLDLIALNYYYNYTGNTNAKFLFDQGVKALKENIGSYDVNGTSYYDAQKTYLASPFYQRVHVTLLNELFKITKEPTFKKYRDEWGSYIKLHG